MDRSRTEAFSDGVFAVAITLLVLNFHPPQGDLRTGLLDMWPSYFAYIVSFMTIGIMWANHHAMFRQVARVDRQLQLLNLLLLMAVVLVPFPTDLVGQQLTHDLHGGDASTVMFCYGVVMLLMALGFTGVWFSAILRPGIIDARLSRTELRTATVRFSAGGVVYTAATLIALWQPLVSLVLFGLTSVYYAFEHLPRAVEP